MTLLVKGVSMCFCYWHKKAIKSTAPICEVHTQGNFCTKSLLGVKTVKFTANLPLQYGDCSKGGTSPRSCGAFILRKRLLAPRVGASKRILAPRLGNGFPLSFIFSLGANNLIVGKRLLAPRFCASKSKDILAPR